MYPSMNNQKSDTLQSKGGKTREEKFREMLKRIASPISKKDRLKSNDNKTMANRNDRCLMLYQKGRVKAENAKLKVQQIQVEKEDKIMSQCTFKPQTIASFGKKDKHLSGEEFYEKEIEWKNKQKEKIEKVIADKKKKEVIYSFKPETRTTSKGLFNPKKNIDKNNKNTKKFMERLENARTEEVKKKERLYSHGKIRASFSPKQVKTFSQDLIHNNAATNGTSSKYNNVVRNLRSQLQEMKLESANQIYI